MKVLLALGCLLSLSAHGQTSCSLEASAPGVHICFPSATSPGATAKTVPEIFHLSAQANAADGQTVNRFLVALDGQRIYEERLATPRQQLSIEVNLKSPYSSGTHKLQLTVPGAGSAERKDLLFGPAKFVDHCNPDIGGITRTCFLMRLGEPLRWTVPDGANFRDVLLRFDDNLRSLEADTADAVAIDAAGHLYTASHAFSDLELRKYDPSGSLVYDSIVRACSPGFTAVAALKVNDAGRVSLAADTDACFGAEQRNRALHGLLFELDTTKPSSAPPVDIRSFTPSPVSDILAQAETPKGPVTIVRKGRRLLLTGSACRVALPDVADVALQPALDAFVAQNGASICPSSRF